MTIMQGISSPLKNVIKNRILRVARDCRIFSTEHITRWFKDYARPDKKAMEYIQPLIDEKLLESKERVLKKPKGFEPHLFRLTKKGREHMEVDYPPIPFSNSRVPHWLLIGDVYLDMCELEQPFKFLPEQRLNGGRFNPDIFAIWLGRAMWIEVQGPKSPLTSKQWAKKWSRYNEYINQKLYRNESWQPDTKKVKPRVVVISRQMPETIQSGADFEIETVESVLELPNRF
jgi:hypothetical protein